MTDRPILFSAPMVLALLEGRKTQTRRVLWPQPELLPDGSWHVFGTGGGVYGVPSEDIASTAIDFVKYAVSDRLWVREAWVDASMGGAATDTVYFRATPDAVLFKTKAGTWETQPPTRLVAAPKRWRSPIHMPRWASRLTLVVTDVRVQRLQDISGDDCVKEGLPPVRGAAMSVYYESRNANAEAMRRWQAGMRKQFRDLWTSINGPGSWDANPWVMAIGFDVHPCNIDQMETK